MNHSRKEIARADYSQEIVAISARASENEQALCTHSLDGFPEGQKGRCNRVSAAGGGGDGGLDLDLASVLTCNNGRNKLCIILRVARAGFNRFRGAHDFIALRANALLREAALARGHSRMCNKFLLINSQIHTIINGIARDASLLR